MSDQHSTNEQGTTKDGALPSLDVTEVLGAPQARVKSKTNVGKFMILLIVLAAFLFIVVGLLFWQRHKKAQEASQPIVTTQAPTAQKTPAYATRNDAVGDAGIDKTKAELKKKEEEAEAAKKELEAAQSAAAGEEAAAKRSGNQTGQRSASGATSAENGNQGQQRNGQAGSGTSTGGTSASAKPKTGVLLELTGAKPNGQGQTTEKEQQEKVQAEYRRRMSSVNGAGAQKVSTSADPSAAGATGGDSLAGRLQPTVLQARNAGRLPNLDFLLKKATAIPCALKTGIDTTVPGFVVCEVLTDVYSANTKTLLIERGATVFGEQLSSLKQGQERTFVLWTRIDNPSGVFADIDSPATDQMGYSGIPGYVDTHFWTRFGGAIMLSMIRDFSTAASQRYSGTQNGANYNNTQQATQDMAAEAVRNTVNIPPTLTVLPGTVVNVLVARDVSFENVYDIVE